MIGGMMSFSWHGQSGVCCEATGIGAFDHREQLSRTRCLRECSPLPYPLGAGEPLAADQEEYKSDVELTDHHGEAVVNASSNSVA
jgi:hypothetical protein